MSDKRHFIFAHDTARRQAAAWCMNAPQGYHCVIQPANRTLEQNSLLWPLLGEISAKVDWYGQKLTDEEWKDVLTAALKKEKVVPGINGGFVVLGQRTSKMNKKDFSELLELTMAFAAQHGVNMRISA